MSNSPQQPPRQSSKPTSSPKDDSASSSVDLDSSLKKAEEIKNKFMQSLEPENMSIPAKRLVAGFIDLTLIACFTTFLHIPLLPFYAVLPSFLTSLFSCVIMTIGGVLILIKDAPYKIAILDRQSIGKKLMSLRVVKGPDHLPITTADSVTRNILLAIPYFATAVISLINILPFKLLVGMVVMLLSGILFIVLLALYGFEIFTMFKDAEGRRWGDKKAGTMVILE